MGSTTLYLSQNKELFFPLLEYNRYSVNTTSKILSFTSHSESVTDYKMVTLAKSHSLFDNSQSHKKKKKTIVIETNFHFNCSYTVKIFIFIFFAADQVKNNKVIRGVKLQST